MSANRWRLVDRFETWRRDEDEDSGWRRGGEEGEVGWKRGEKSWGKRKRNAGGGNSLIIKTVLRKKKRVGCPPRSRSAFSVGRSVGILASSRRLINLITAFARFSPAPPHSRMALCIPRFCRGEYNDFAGLVGLGGRRRWEGTRRWRNKEENDSIGRSPFYPLDFFASSGGGGEGGLMNGEKRREKG